MKLEFTYYTDEGDEEIVSLPGKYEVCDRCRGSGTVDCFEGGWSANDFETEADLIDFQEEYSRGTYDKLCDECKGQRVVMVIDEELCDPIWLERYHKQLRE